MSVEMSRYDYAGMYGPTTGDKLRLADTELVIEVERDLTIYGEEVKFGGGKVIRDGMGQSQATRAAGAPDTVITNALILDYTGIYKADVKNFLFTFSNGVAPFVLSIPFLTTVIPTTGHTIVTNRDNTIILYNNRTYL